MILLGDCRETLARLEPESVDACVTDPPYELGFMGKAWDRSGVTYDVATWRAVLRVMKPGAHLLAFGGTRTYHRMACAIEDAGFEIRDQLQWLYGSGFPKSLNGPWGGTALKPANEPIVLARKPLVGTVAENVQAHGTGALNIDGCRIATEPDANLGGGRISSRADGWDRPWKADPDAVAAAHERGAEAIAKAEALGRWPANVLLDEEAARLLDEQSGESQSPSAPVRQGGRHGFGVGAQNGPERDGFGIGYGDAGGASRFFYVAKPSRSERGEENDHPTVKPVDLLRYLIRLVTPPGGVVLDPFAGSGTTCLAAQEEGFRWIACELLEKHVDIIRARTAQETLFGGSAA